MPNRTDWTIVLAALLGALAAFFFAPAAAFAQDPVYVDDSVNDGLVTHFKFDENAGASTRDWITFPLTATLGSGASFNASVPVTLTVPNVTSLSLSGSRGITITASAATNAISALTTDFTFAAWVRRSLTGTQVAIFQNGNNSSYWGVSISSGNSLQLTTFSTVYFSGAFPQLGEVGVWHHVAVAYSQAGAPTLRFFVDGQVQNGGNTTISATPTGNIYIGTRQFDLDRFTGQIDDLRLYNRALTNAEVQRLAQGKGCVFDGLSWATAMRELQCGLAEVAANGQVWVAQGSYLPSYNRTVPFAPARSMTIYGGFEGDEVSVAERPEFDPQAPLTILTGDVLGNDIGFTNNGENTNSIIAPTSSIALTLDGLAVRGGNASATPFTGGAIRFPTSGALRVSNAAFVNNRANNQGGAIQSSSRVTVTASLFFSNTAGNRGARFALTTLLPASPRSRPPSRATSPPAAEVRSIRRIPPSPTPPLQPTAAQAVGRSIQPRMAQPSPAAASPATRRP